MNNTFELKFKNSYSSLSGNKFGLNTYREQVEPDIDFSKKIIIVFPDSIEDIGMSFFQGFFGPIKERINLYGIEKRVDVKSNTIIDLKEKVLKSLMV